jgi:malonate transporter and related proteins
MAKTPFAELNNPPFLIATTLGTACALTAVMWLMQTGRLVFP